MAGLNWLVRLIRRWTMSIQRLMAQVVRHRVHNPLVRRWLGVAETSLELVRNTASRIVPGLVTPSPRSLTVAITAKCNLRCTGCRYGRDYMTGHELPTKMVKRLLRDASAAGISTVRLYGGEPLLHPGLSMMVADSVALGITPFVTTNGQILDRHLSALFDAGLRIITFGYYGHENTYDRYVGRCGAWDRFEASVANARDKYQDNVTLHMSYVLNTLTCSLAELQKAWEFAQRYNLVFHVDLVHYSLPYFTEGPDRELQFAPTDFSRICQFVDHLAKLKQQRPDLYSESDVSIRAIPDWLLKGPAMRVPCDAYDMIWVGADGSVRLCFVTFPLGNLHVNPLSELLFTPAHKKAAVGAVQLACPNCHCHRDTRIAKHLPSLLRYSLRRHVDPPSPSSAQDSCAFPIMGQSQRRCESADSAVPVRLKDEATIHGNGSRTERTCTERDS
jgi:MoaA/NifB/PqqE/SkfB family radical SAM enzyme